jgi:hypothetical protein
MDRVLRQLTTLAHLSEALGTKGDCTARANDTAEGLGG